ncbi:MAG TPA: cupin domain-containing protein [Candidatus Binatia bacterium]|nr:cupin domain-containing protein [Candidatus Binatia bacterium]
MHAEAAELIARLGLRRHPEGGWFREVHRSRATVQFDNRYRIVQRSALTSIYYLLEGDDFSALHRLRSDEVWYFHAGAVLAIYAIDAAAALTVHRLGDASKSPGTTFSIAIPAGTWFGARLEERDAWALAGCAVAPGFEFEDFELAGRGVLTAAFPQHGPVIAALTRGST